ncbi:hypothetical protein G6F43_004591 [Rhizopus delemar]|nr:hypothetical protein G6F43_004591 [Rhizopus delemar]
MPSLLSDILFNNKKNKSCGNIFGPPRWFAKLRRKSTLSTAIRYSQEVEEEINFDKEIDLFEKSYKLASEELRYAVESQGSIYYRGDFIATTEAVEHCIYQFHHLSRSLQPAKANLFQHRWSNALCLLQSRLDDLPLPIDSY